LTPAADAGARLAALAARYRLPAGAEERLATLLDLVAAEPAAITTVRDPAEGVNAHVADSLVALDLPAVHGARRVADLGSGGGFPGLALAIALPVARVALVESVGRKCAFLVAAAAELGLANVEVVNARAEAWPEGIGAHDLVVARALAPLSVLVEYAAPLLEPGGALLAWKGRREPAEEADGAAAADALGMSAPQAISVDPFPQARDRHLYLSSKVSATPGHYPRRPGMARKRPIQASS
jgi:16S rRNA (guanine527-N7)-methyltransferase